MKEEVGGHFVHHRNQAAVWAATLMLEIAER